MGDVLLGELSAEQELLLREIFGPFDRNGEWPVWQYVDYRLDARGLVAGEVLKSLPVAGGPGLQRVRYGLVWHSDHMSVPNDGTQVALTAAGLWHVRPEAMWLTDAFGETVRFLAGRVRGLEPSPSKVVEVMVSSLEVGRHLVGVGAPAVSGPAAEITVRKVGQILEHEPYLWSGFGRPHPGYEQWQLRISPVLRELAPGVDTAGYVRWMEQLVEPPAQAMPVQAPFAGPLEIPFAVGYLDAVWQSRTGGHLFVNLDPASVARLTQPCGSEQEFNSLMSALADVAGQVVTPGAATPPQREALEKVRAWLVPQLDTDAAARVTRAFGDLITLRHIRVSTQHADARYKAVEAFREIGLAFPPPDWDQAWTHIAVMAMGALTTIREEVHAGLPQH